MCEIYNIEETSKSQLQFQLTLLLFSLALICFTKPLACTRSSKAIHENDLGGCLRMRYFFQDLDLVE